MKLFLDGREGRGRAGIKKGMSNRRRKTMGGTKSSCSGHELDLASDQWSKLSLSTSPLPGSMKEGTQGIRTQVSLLGDGEVFGH